MYQIKQHQTLNHAREKATFKLSFLGIWFTMCRKRFLYGDTFNHINSFPPEYKVVKARYRFYHLKCQAKIVTIFSGLCSECSKVKNIIDPKGRDMRKLLYNSNLKHTIQIPKYSAPYTFLGNVAMAEKFL